jgi:hypothetical protein
MVSQFEICRLTNPVMVSVLFCLSLCGCSSFTASPVALPTAVSAPPDQKALAAKIEQVFTTTKLPGSPEVSAVHRAALIAPAEWMICLKSDAPDQRLKYAVFFKDNDVKDYRIAVQIDRCDQEPYRPLRAAER